MAWTKVLLAGDAADPGHTHLEADITDLDHDAAGTAHGEGAHTGTIGYVPSSMVVPLAGTLAVANDVAPHFGPPSLIDSIDEIYFVGKAAFNFTCTITCYDQANVQQWQEAGIVANSGANEYYSHTTAATRSIPQYGYLEIDITAVTSGADISVQPMGRKAVTAS